MAAAAAAAMAAAVAAAMAAAAPAAPTVVAVMLPEHAAGKDFGSCSLAARTGDAQSLQVLLPRFGDERFPFFTFRMP